MVSAPELMCPICFSIASCFGRLDWCSRSRIWTRLWQADDLCRVIQILVRNRDLLDSMEGGLATLANQLLKVWHFANRNSRHGSRKNIAAHYDLGNDLFELFLDQHGMYSSATFYHADLGLEQASTAKLERICRKLDLTPEDHVLEIGTGWGGFAAYAASVYGCQSDHDDHFQTTVRRPHGSELPKPALQTGLRC